MGSRKTKLPFRPPAERGIRPVDETKRLHEEIDDLVSDGEFSDLGGFTDDLDTDINELPPWKKH